MPRRGTSARAAALRRAQEAKAARDAGRLRREQDIEAALADYFEATTRAGQVRAEAQRKADQLLATAEQAAGAPERAAAAAVRRLRDLTGTAAEVAGLCQITASEVRALLAGPPSGLGPRADPAGPTGSPLAPGSDLAHGAAELGAGPVILDRDAPGDGHQPGAAAGEGGDGLG
jgi:hypothetical protein